MVKVRARLLLAAGLMLCRVIVAQEVSVEAIADRTTIRENESFTYTVRVEGSVRGDPSVTGLAEDFDVLNRSTNTRIQIVNGRTEQVAEWQYQLMPRQTGTFVIPPAQIAGIASNALEIEVLAGLQADDELADIFMEIEALPEQAYVQSQIIFTLRLFVGIGTGRATLTAPEVDGVEAIVERLGDDANYSTVRGGRNFVVRERRYAVFAQAPGNLTIGPVVFEVMVIPNRGFSRVQRYRSDSLGVEILPAVAPPAAWPQAVWLPARRVEISERWSEAPEIFEMGIPRTRTLTVAADGLLETQLPELELVSADGIRQYADQPDLDRSVSTAGLTAQRTERYAVIAQRAGAVELPAIELPWWNVDARQWEVARIEPRTIEVAPSTEPGAPVVEAAAEPVIPVPPEVVQSTAPWWLSAFLGLGWLLTVGAWWYTARAASLRQSGDARSRHGKFSGSPRAALNGIERACNVSDASAARDALLTWASLETAYADCHSLGALAEHLSEEAGDAVRELERHLYSPLDEAWDGARLGASIKALRSMAERTRKTDSDPLPSLYS